MVKWFLMILILPAIGWKSVNAETAFGVSNVFELKYSTSTREKNPSRNKIIKIHAGEELKIFTEGGISFNTIRIYDAAGNMVIDLSNKMRCNSGIYTVDFSNWKSGKNMLVPGSYVAVLGSDAERASHSTMFSIVK